MATFNPIQQSAPDLEIFARLFNGIVAGNKLDVFKGEGNPLRVYDYPQRNIRGESDLPMLTVMEYQDFDGPFAGKLSGSGTDAQIRAKLNINIQTECTLNLVLACSRLNGLTRKTAAAAPGLKDWLLAIKDCIETALDQRTPDSGLNGTCNRPLMISTRDNFADDLTWAIALEIKYFPLATIKGTRVDAWPRQMNEVIDPTIDPNGPAV